MRRRPWLARAGAGPTRMRKPWRVCPVLLVVVGAVACGNASHSSSSGGQSSASTVTVDGQPLAISVQSFNNTPPPTAAPNIEGQPGVPLAPDERVGFLTLSFTNQGHSAVSVPLGEQTGAEYQAPIDVTISVTDSTSPPMEQNLNFGTQEVVPGQGVNAYYQIVMYGPDAYATQVQVSVDASVGSGSVTLPIQDSVPTTTSPPSTAPPTTPPGAISPTTIQASNVSADCTAQALTQAAVASAQAPSDTQVLDSVFACIQQYAEAFVAPKSDITNVGAAYYRNDSGHWTVLAIGEVGASVPGMPDDIKTELDNKVAALAKGNPSVPTFP